ncbi:MAG: Foldase protein PrsA precursor [Micavibrio sp.]|nr:Foldase protein PrsA precursor [Micavibrio sp.]
MTFKHTTIALAFVSVIALGAAQGWAADAPKDAAPAAAAAAPATINQDPVVAKIGKDEIKRSEVFGLITTLPDQVKQMPLDQLFPLALDQVINNKIVGEKAEKAKLEGDPEVAKLTEQAKSQIIRNVYVEHELGKMITEADLKKAYDKAVAAMPKEEVHARHILVKDEATAKDIIKKLDGGAKFEDLASQSTDGPTAKNGGDLGYFNKTQMVPEFADAAFKLKPGSYSKDPIKTQFGYHVIKVEDKRPITPPKFEDVKAQLDAQVRREKLGTLLEKWQKDASITKFDINGAPVKETKKN